MNSSLFQALRVFTLGLGFIAAVQTQGALAAELGLFDFQVYALDRIESARSDYEGLTGSGGPIELKNFLIRRFPPKAGVASSHDEFGILGANTVRVELTRVERAVRDTQGTKWELASIEGTKVRSPGSQVRRHREVKPERSPRPEGKFSVNHADIASEMRALSRALEQRMLGVALQPRSEIQVTTPGAHFFRINEFSLRWSTTLKIRAPREARLIIQIDPDPRSNGVLDLRGVGFEVSGGIEPEGILFHLPAVTELRLQDTGAPDWVYSKRVGIPGTVLASQARLVFQRALVTGGVFVREIVLDPSLTGGAAANGGQVNVGCFAGKATLGFGC